MEIITASHSFQAGGGFTIARFINQKSASLGHCHVFLNYTEPAQSFGVGDQTCYFLVSTVGVTDIPTLNIDLASSFIEIRTGRRWTTFVKLLDVLCGAMGEKLALLAAPKLSTVPENFLPGKVSTAMRTFCPARMLASWVSLKYASI